MLFNCINIYSSCWRWCKRSPKATIKIHQDDYHLGFPFYYQVEIPQGNSYIKNSFIRSFKPTHGKWAKSSAKISNLDTLAVKYSRAYAYDDGAFHLIGKMVNKISAQMIYAHMSITDNPIDDHSWLNSMVCFSTSVVAVTIDNDYNKVL